MSASLAPRRQAPRPWADWEVRILTPYGQNKAALTNWERAYLAGKFHRSEASVLTKVQDLRRANFPEQYAPKNLARTRPKPEPLRLDLSPFDVRRDCLECGHPFVSARRNARIRCDACRCTP